MIRIETENPRHLSRVSMRGSWFSHRVHPEGLEPSTNGLRNITFAILFFNWVNNYLNLTPVPKTIAPSLGIWSGKTASSSTFSVTAPTRAPVKDVEPVACLPSII